MPNIRAHSLTKLITTLYIFNYLIQNGKHMTITRCWYTKMSVNWWNKCQKETLA